MVDTKKVLEEKIREAACYGNLELTQELVLKGVDINSKNAVNGWTALHWAAHRNQKEIVLLLLKCGADKTSLTYNGETPGALSTSKEIQLLLEGKVTNKTEDVLPIVPNYLRNPPLSLPDIIKVRSNESTQSVPSSEKELVLKIRLADSSDPDFIEVELPTSELTYEKLKEVCEQELNISSITKIRKLPNTIIRKDRDVQRLKDFQEIEVVATEFL